MQTSYMKLIMV